MVQKSSNRSIFIFFLASHFEFMFIGHCHCFNPHLKVVTGLIDAQLQDVYKLFWIDESITSQFNHMAATLQKIKLDWEESLLMRSIAVTSAGKVKYAPKWTTYTGLSTCFMCCITLILISWFQS